MRPKKYLFQVAALALIVLVTSACHDILDEPAENRAFTEETDYTVSEDMILPLNGAYAELYSRGWEEFPLISVRGDDVNHGGLGDQQDYAETDFFNYNKDYWMYNSVWQNYYRDLYYAYAAQEQIELYKENGADAALADQYIAETKVIRAWYLFQLARVWGSIYIPESADPSDLLVAELSSKEEVLQFISNELADAATFLPKVHPADRVDVPGGVTKYTALAIKALADLEMNNYQAVADATGEIIASGEYELESDFYQLFKIPGKLSRENILEFQYSDFGQGSGDSKSYLYAFFGPQSYDPKVAGAAGGWGFYEPSIKWIKFMLERGETTRLQTSVLFTPRGIAELESDPDVGSLPDWISNETPSGDIINDYPRAIFASGKHYLPSDQLITGRTEYGSNNNFRCIRYAEILLMHAEALTNGANSSVMTASDAVNEVRERSGMPALSNVTADQVMDEKFAELAMEWGTRYYDMLRLGRYSELSYEGRTFTGEKAYLPYPQNQVDLLPGLRTNN